MARDPMEPLKNLGGSAAELRSIEGGKRSFSIGGAVGTTAVWALGLLALIAVGCAILGGVWLLEQLWNAVS